LTEIDFGKVATGVGKDITFVIENLNPIPVVFEKIKKRSIDDLKVILSKVTDKFGNEVVPIW
jgi:predicted transcriptional regulator